MVSQQVLIISRERDSTTALGSLSQGSNTLILFLAEQGTRILHISRTSDLEIGVIEEEFLPYPHAVSHIKHY